MGHISELYEFLSGARDWQKDSVKEMKRCLKTVKKYRSYRMNGQAAKYFYDLIFSAYVSAEETSSQLEFTMEELATPSGIFREGGEDDGDSSEDGLKT